MWSDLFTKTERPDLPSQVESGRYIWQGKHTESLNGHSEIHQGELLVSDGSERCCLSQTSHLFLMPDKNRQQDISLFENAITTISKQLVHGGKLMSPMLPSAVVDADSHLLPLEKELQIILEKGHLHQISHRPRLDIRYEEEITDVARAKRLAKGALVHLASHSECWQRQTLSGVVPKKVKARFSEDDFHIYENRVYARLLDKLDTHLSQRIRTVEQLNDTLDEALKFYDNPDIHHRLAHKVCDLWGQTFDEEATLETLTLLEETLATLRAMHHSIHNLKQSGLYLLINRNAQIGGVLHRTNILNHDAHYRFVAVLWDQLNQHQQRAKLSPAERFTQQQQLAEYYSQFTGLALQHALQPYLPAEQGGHYTNELEYSWAGRRFILQQQGLDWILSCTDDTTATANILLHLTPTISFRDLPDDINQNQNTQIAWPSIEQISTEHPLADNQQIPLSPLDLYSIERLGWLIDHIFIRILVEPYGKPIEKIPNKPTQWLSSQISSGLLSNSSISISENTPPSIQIFEDLPDASTRQLIEELENSNARSKAREVELRLEEIKALQVCPICKTQSPLRGQENQSFSIECPSCSNRYLRYNHGQTVFELKINKDKLPDTFAAKGRWFNDSR